MEERHPTLGTQVLGALTSRRPLVSAMIGTAAWALGRASQVDAEQETLSQPAAEAEAPVPVNLVAKIAGEDLVNDWMKVVSEPDMLTTHTHESLEVKAGETLPSQPVPSAQFRAYTAMASGQTGVITLRLEISPDDGLTWFWHPDGESAVDQYPVMSGSLVAPLCRVSVVNRDPADQTVQSWLVLTR
jgi:hypothetical protein